MNFKGIIFNNGLYVIDLHYVNLYNKILKSIKVKDDKDLRKILYLMYCEDSPYYEISIDERLRNILHYEGLNKDEKEITDIVTNFGEKILELFENQEERVYRKLRERIDKLIQEYSNSQVNLEELAEEPKKVKAISELLGIKEKILLNIKRKGKNRGDKEESIIEQI